MKSALKVVSYLNSAWSHGGNSTHAERYKSTIRKLGYISPSYMPEKT